MDESSSLLANAMPKDKYHMVYWGFFLSGMATLMPWNAFITIADYYRLKFTGSIYSDNFNNYFALGFTAINIAALFYALRNQANANLTTRIVASFALSALIFFTCMLLIPFSIEPNFFFYTNFIMVLTTGITTALSQNGVYGKAAQLPPEYIQAVNLGAAVAGVAVSIAQIVTVWSTAGSSNNLLADKTAYKAHQDESAFYYFLTTFVIIAAAVVAMIMMQRSPFYVYYTSLAAKDDFVVDEVIDEEDCELQSEYSTAAENSRADSTSDSADDLVGITTPQTQFWKVYSTISVHAISLWYVFVVTLALFPAITASVQSVQQTESLFFNELFVPFHFLLFNVGDWVGRIMANYPVFVFTSSRSLALLSFSRTLFFPLVFFSNVIIRDEAQNIVPRIFPCLLGNDLLYWIIISLFAISNGWLCSLITMAAPQECNYTEKEYAGTLLITFLSVGTAMGSLLSFGIRALLCGCNPFIS